MRVCQQKSRIITFEEHERAGHVWIVVEDEVQIVLSAKTDGDDPLVVHYEAVALAQVAHSVATVLKITILSQQQGLI